MTNVAETASVPEETRKTGGRSRLRGILAATEIDLRLFGMLVALAEPLLLMAMASIIGTVVVGMLLPVFTMQDLIQ